MDAATKRQEALTRIIGEALDDGVFYNDDLNVYVAARFVGIDEAKDVCIGSFVEPDFTEGDGKERFQARKAWFDAFADRVKAAPRGTWATYSFIGNRAEPYYKAIMSDGSGKLGTGGSSDTHESPPTYETIYGRMFGYETYLARKEVEQARNLQADKEAVAACGIEAGQVHKGVSMRIKEHTFTRVEVTGVSEDTGQVSVRMGKRGSARTWTSDMRATQFVERLGLEPVPPAPAP